MGRLTMQNWHRQFLGRTQMPPTLSGFVINEFFTLRQAELQAVLSRYGVDMRVGAALQIGFLKRPRRTFVAESGVLMMRCSR
jgi:hypothetical protein